MDKEYQNDELRDVGDTEDVEINKEQWERPVPHDQNPNLQRHTGGSGGWGGSGFPWLTCLGVTILIVIVLFIAIPSLLCARRAPWQSRAKGTLRSIGSSQLAYQGTNDAHDFGSFDALQADLYIAEGYTLENMIENYTMTWEIYNNSTVMDELTGLTGVHTFTVIAYPRDTRPGYLLTFAVTEDQVVRVYNPENDNEFDDVYNWDPIL